MPSEYHIPLVKPLIILLMIANAGAAFAQAQPATAAPATARWLDLQTLSVSFRYRRINNTTGDVTSNVLQEKTQFRARLKFDPNGRYTVNVGVFSGGGFTSSWNSTGVGTGTGTVQHSVKQLFISAKPTKGLELQYGGLYIDKGVSSEITYYDDDGYVVGERVSLDRADRLFFDDITATLGGFGDTSEPNVFHRLDSLDQTNYKQLQVTKRAGSRASGSFDYTRVDTTSTIRPALTVRVPETRVVDQVHLELYHRYGSDPATGFAAEVARSFKRVRVTAGYADIDPNYGGLNGDRYNKGKRIYATAAVPLPDHFSLSLFGTHAVGSNPKLSNDVRTDVILTYNFLPVLRKTGVF